ncbi:hypothetical protein Tco_1522778 [Tanacetum coccineum]
MEMIKNDWELESKEVSFLGRRLNSPVRPKEVEKVIDDIPPSPARSMGIRHAKAYTLRGRSSMKLGQRYVMKTSELNLNTSVRTTMKSERWNQDPSLIEKLLQPFGQGLLWSVGSEKELWDLRKHQTGKEAEEEEMQKPFIPSSLHTPTGLVPIHVNPYSQPSAGLVNGQTPNFPFQTHIGNPHAGGISTYHPQGGIYYRLSPTMAYLHTMGLCSFADPIGSVTHFVRWIEDYPLPNGLKMPSHIGSYDRKGDPDNFLHLFEGAIRIQKWLMPVACHMFTCTLKDSARIWWNSQKTSSILNYEDLKAKFRYTDDTLQILGLHEEQCISGFVHGLRARSLVEHLFTDLPSTYKGLMEKTYTWIEAREVATNGAPNDRRENFKRSKKSFWANNQGQKSRDRSWARHKSMSGIKPLDRRSSEIRAAGSFGKSSKEEREGVRHSVRRTAMQQMGIVMSTIYGAIKFYMPQGIDTVLSQYNPREPEEEQRSTSEEH